MTKTLFLPGAGGSALFWSPVVTELHIENSVCLSWPGLGNEPAMPNINGIDDLVGMVLRHIDEPVNIVAQSMGGIVAIKAALAMPDKVKKLVLTATSGGIPVDDLYVTDWRSDYYRSFPHAAKWIGEVMLDLSAEIKTIQSSTLLLWGDHDLVSPVTVGERLLQLMQDARLNIITDGDHDMAMTHCREVSDLIQRFLSEH